MDHSTLTIYPTARKATDELMRISRGGCAFGARITTLPQVVDALWSESLDPRAPLNEVGERVILIEALAQAAPAPINPSSGMADRILALIRQLKSAGLTAADWRAAYDTLPSPDQLRLAVFTPIFDAYAELLVTRHLADRHDREAAALDFLHQSERAGRRPIYLAGVEHLFVAEIYDLSLLQFMTVAALIRLVGDAQLTIQAEPHKVDASRFSDLTWNRFVSEESIADQVLPEFVRRTERPGRLGFVVEHVFSGDSPAPPDPDATVTIIAAANPRDEVEAVARAIRARLEREDVPLGRIGIVARDLASYRDYLEAAFRRYQIPLGLEIGQPVRATSPARALLQLVAIPLEDYRRDALLALCASPYVRPAAADFRSMLDEIGYLDRSTRSLVDCFESRQRGLASLDDPADGLFARGVVQRERLRRGAAAWTELLDALATLEAPATMPTYLARLTTLLERLRFDPTAGALTGPGAPGAGALWRALDELTVEAARAVADRTITLQEFRPTLEAVLRDTAVDSGTPDGAVRALSVRDARGLDFDLLFMLGLNDGVFPRYHPEDPLTPDATAIALNRTLRGWLARRFGDRAPNAPGAILRTRGQRNSEEPFLFFLALSMPEREIVLSCSTEGEGGRPLARSAFLEEVRRLLGTNGDRLPDGSGAHENRCLDWQDCFDEGDFLNQAAERDALSETLAVGSLDVGRIQSIRERIAIERQRTHYLSLPSREELLKVQQRTGKKTGSKNTNKDKNGWAFAELAQAGSAKAAHAGPYDGRVTTSPALVRLVRGDERAYRWSPSQLSELAACGFKFFAHRMLKLRDEEEVDHAPTRLETGELVHRILSEYFDAQPDFSRPEAALTLVSQIAEPIRRRERELARDQAFFDLEWATIQAMLEEVVRYEVERHRSPEPTSSDLDVKILHEHPFELQLEAPIADTTDDSGTARWPIIVQGRIDRLELHRGTANLIESLRVIDYKTSSGLKALAQKLRSSDFAVSDLQIPVYLLAAVAEFRTQLTSGITLQASFIALKNRDKETEPLIVPLDLLDPVKPQATAPDSPSVADRVRGLVATVLDGRFDIDPLECRDWCGYRPVCRFTKASSS